MGYIEKYHSKNLDLYISLDCIVLDDYREYLKLLNAMNDINWVTKHDHVQDSLIAKLQRIRTFGQFKLVAFVGLISKKDYDICKEYKPRTLSWYPFTMDIFMKFLYARLRRCLTRCLLDLLQDHAQEWPWSVWSAMDKAIAETVKFWRGQSSRDTTVPSRTKI